MSWYLIGALFLVGLWGLLACPNLIKKVMSLSVANTAIVLFWVFQASLAGTTAPILTRDAGPIADPLPQALMLTAIVVGICVLALALVLTYRLYERFGTLDLREIERRSIGENE